MNNNLINSEQPYNPQLPNQQINPQLPNQQVNPQPVPQQYIPPSVNLQSIVLHLSNQKYNLVQSVNIQYIPQQALQSIKQPTNFATSFPASTRTASSTRNSTK